MLASRSPARPRRLLAAFAALLAIGAGAGTALAADSPSAPSARWPSNGAAIRTAMGVAADYWGSVPCRGRVDIAWDTLARGVNATSSWANDVDPYAQPSLNTECEIALSMNADWDWPMLCSVIVHEVGHLDGHDHVDDPRNIMHPTYVAPVSVCTDTAEPVESATAPPLVTAPAPPLVASPVAVQSVRRAAAPRAKMPAQPRRTKQTKRRKHRRLARPRRT